jgi:aspartate-semialdehyde dehydrogenase
MRVAVVGATGAVGTDLLRLLRLRGFPATSVVPFASERSAGRTLEGADEPVRVLADDTIDGFDVALFSAGGATSRAWAPKFVEHGATVVDNSSAWRMHDDVPLVVSEVNPDALEGHRGIIANPNCTTMVAMLPLKALHDAYGLRALVATSYQAAGGAGQKGIDELAAQVPVLAQDVEALRTDGATAMRRVQHAVHADTLAFTVVPMLGTIGEEGYTDEELKLRNESRKILDIPDLPVSGTCVRVPVFTGHSLSINAEFARPLTVARATEILAAAPGVELSDVPNPLQAAGADPSYVGRIRVDEGVADGRGLALFVSGDNLRKGAALNAVQIAELVAAAR